MNTKNPTVADYMTPSPHSIGFDLTRVQAHRLRALADALDAKG